MSFEEAYNEYLIFASKQQKKQSFESLSARFNSHILPYFNGKDLKEISKNDIILWQQEILKFNFSNNYNKNLHFLLSGFLHYCCNCDYIQNNVASQVGSFKKKYESTKVDFYTMKEFRQFIKSIDNEIYKQFFNLMFFTGTRPGEAMALKFSDLSNGYININKTISSHGNREVGTPKTSSSIRKIKIDRRLEKDLLKLHKYYNENYSLKDFDYFIFGGIKPLSPTTINRYKIIACKKGNIRPITLHQFRHSHATLLLHKGIIINEISRRLGHSKVSTTLDIYTHTNLTQEKRVTRTLNFIRYILF